MKPNLVRSDPTVLSLKVGFSELAAGVGDGLEASSFTNVRVQGTLGRQEDAGGGCSLQGVHMSRDLA